MPGWIVQGVRGEGKGLAAVWMMKQYIARGCPVATNMDIYIDKLANKNSNVPVYRLPDFPRVQDFNILPPAYDPKYKGEDKNGLIVLDELALWMNSRTFKDKQRLAIIGWLILSRKNHWDLLLTVQSHEMIDTQIRTTLCDFLVQASRTDRQKIPIFGSFLSFLGFSPYGKQHHKYDVYYGMSLNQDSQDRWSFSGREVYDAYDTNQKLQSDDLVIEGKSLEDVAVVDFRATYTYLPASYLSGQFYIQKEQLIIDKAQSLADSIKNKRNKRIKKLKNPSPTLKQIEKKKQDNDFMALVKDTARFSPKFILLTISLIGFVVYKFLLNPPGYLESSEPVQHSQVLANSDSKVDSKPNSFLSSSFSSDKPILPTMHQVETSFLDDLITEYTPRLQGIYTDLKGTHVLLSFYDQDYVNVATFKTAHIQEMGGVVILKEYGVFLRTAKNMMLITSWAIPSNAGFSDPSKNSDHKKDPDSSTLLSNLF